ncbi:TolC family protein [Natronoflexus pectinivorans]|uniref:Cobalt-zinc-cadmium efflux system outer membrane protein n=1 Tax=Natronoflexus pectinivorans TaxID=682526 RepID=A0A4R2GKI6_9BACT|nr:TolC family protein [Natronoflexus pectinivorans]TCO09189.1 cobalt-zinc-cadmium efflux system outer membrane protein [Natronoflexus pectinivorans]
MIQSFYKRNTVFLLVCLYSSASTLFAGDTIKLSVQDAEKVFLENNLQLIATRMNMDIAAAETAQARLWNNPQISIEEINLHRIPSSRLFDDLPGRPQQFSIEIEQEIRTAKKRSRLVEMHRLQEAVEEDLFYDVLRHLKKELRMAFYSLVYSKNLIELLENEIDAIRRLVKAMEQEFLRENISALELTRTKALLFSLQTELTAEKSEWFQHQNRLRLLLNLPLHQNIEPLITNNYAILPDMPVDELTAQALISRRDYLAQNRVLQIREVEYRYERSQRVPDITFSGIYDRWGGISEDFIGFGISFDLPVFNRNQHAARAAAIGIDQQQNKLNQYKKELQQEVAEALKHYNEILLLYQAMDADFISTFEQMHRVMLEGFKNREVGLVEFMDFFDSYKSARVNHNEIKLKLHKAREKLNFAVGTDLF